MPAISRRTARIAAFLLPLVLLICPEAFAAKFWTNPSSITDSISPDTKEAVSPQIAMDDNGNAIIVWQQFDGDHIRHIFKSELRNGVWTHPSSLYDTISPDGKDAYIPQVAMDNNGNAIIVWREDDTSGADQIFKSEYRNGAWTHPTGLADNISPDYQSASNPQVAMDDNGNAIIVWQQSDGSNSQIFKSEYRNGVWTHPAGWSDNISPDGQDVYYPQVAMDDNGNAIITWAQRDGVYPNNFQHIFKSEYRNGAWTHPSGLTDNISPDDSACFVPQVAMDSMGNAIITWMQPGISFYDIFKSEYRNGVWTHPSDRTDYISFDGKFAYDPQVAMDDNGNAIITWQQHDGSAYQIFKSEYRNGAWTHPTGLADNISPDSQNTYSPQVAMDDNGNAIIVWRQFDASYQQIFKSEYRNGAWTHPTGLADNISPDYQSASNPQVAMDDNGNAIIVWQQFDGSVYQIFKSEYREFSISWVGDGFQDTGQTTCYDNSQVIACPAEGEDFHGQDGQYIGPQHVFRDNGDGTVSDLRSMLTWQQGSSDSHLSQADAIAYCADLTLGGRSDWRLPTRKELLRILEHTLGSSSEDEIFTSGHFLWSGTAGSPNNWVINFSNTYTLSSFSGPIYARCVRGQ